MITWLVGEEVKAYEHLTTESLAMSLMQVSVPSHFATAQEPATHSAAGLRFAGGPAALAIVRRQAKSNDALVLSIVVTPLLRGIGLGHELLCWLQAELRQIGVRRLRISYPLEHVCTPAMEKLTSRENGWINRPGLQIMQLDRFGMVNLQQRLAPAVSRLERSGRFAIKEWHEIPASRRHELGQVLNAPWWAHPEDDLPKDPLQQLDQSISAFLLVDGQEAGWITAHRIGIELIRVSQWWIIPEYQGTGASTLLLHHAVKTALESEHRFSRSSFGMEPENGQAIALYRRKIAPFSVSVSKQKMAWLDLGGPGSD